jgi:XRE family transcriptional regulator, regulator of sulfur utilization
MEYKELLKNLGLHFKLARLKKDLSQAKLAEILNSHERYISDIECGRRNITLKTIHKFATAMDIKLSNLFEFDK